MIDVTILCKVVDNYGDIGFVYRLARSLSALSSEVHLRLVVSSLASFARLAPGLDPRQAEQEYSGWQVFDWNASDVCGRAFSEKNPQIILECFQCGRPEWLEDLLFKTGTKNIVHILNIDYLTAEDYAEDFHCLQSLTRSVRVQKVNFMPGFTSKTGGLVLDSPFTAYAADKTSAFSALAPYIPAFSAKCGADLFRVLIFTYPHNFFPVVESLSCFQTEKRRENPHFSVQALVANGLSREPFLEAWKNAGNPFEIIELPFLPQTVWDALYFVSDFLFIRGEDSLSRACLSGTPFIWNAYVQSEDYQLVKVNALLSRMKQYFLPADFSAVSSCWNDFNSLSGKKDMSASFLSLFRNCAEQKKSFSAFARALFQNGDFSTRLLAYIAEINKF